jgi:DNA mismatch repair protein MutS
VLEALEKGEREGPEAQHADRRSAAVFREAAGAARARKGPGKLEARLAEVHPDTLTPREALDLVYALKDLMDD